MCLWVWTSHLPVLGHIGCIFVFLWPHLSLIRQKKPKWDKECGDVDVMRKRPPSIVVVVLGTRKNLKLPPNYLSGSILVTWQQRVCKTGAL